MEKVRIGIIGSGFSAELHADANSRNPRAEIVACASPNRETREKFAAKWKISRTFSDHRVMLPSCTTGSLSKPARMEGPCWR